jgi:hypothetical protein
VICHQAAFLKRKLQQKMGGFDPSYRVAMDYDLWARLCLEGYSVTEYKRPVAVYAYGGYSANHRDLVLQEYHMIAQRLRNTPVKRLVGMLHDQLMDSWRRATWREQGASASAK